MTGYARVRANVHWRLGGVISLPVALMALPSYRPDSVAGIPMTLAPMTWREKLTAFPSTETRISKVEPSLGLGLLFFQVPDPPANRMSRGKVNAGVL
jgi:hypothetical protein